MIEVEADILRGSCTPVFFVGEEIKCEIKFRSLNKMSDAKINDDRKIKMSESMFSILSNQSFNSSAPSTPIFEQNFFTKRDTSQEDENFTLVWSCAQIDCNCFIDESKVMLPKDPLRYNISEKAGDSSVTSFQPHKDRMGISIFSSKPKILFCNLVIGPGEEKTCKEKNCKKNINQFYLLTYFSCIQ